MLGVGCESRMTWTRLTDGEFKFVNEERKDQGEWVCLDEWRFTRSDSAAQVADSLPRRQNPPHHFGVRVRQQLR